MCESCWLNSRTVYKYCYGLMNTACSRKISSHIIQPNDEIPIQVFSLLEGKQKSKLGGVMRAVKY